MAGNILERSDGSSGKRHLAVIEAPVASNR